MYIVVDKSAQMPASCRGRYRRVGVVEVIDPAQPVGMLSERDRNVVSVVKTWEKLSVGKTERCAFQVALREAEALAARLNGGERE